MRGLELTVRPLDSADVGARKAKACAAFSAAGRARPQSRSAQLWEQDFHVSKVLTFAEVLARSETVHVALPPPGSRHDTAASKVEKPLDAPPSRWTL